MDTISCIHRNKISLKKRKKWKETVFTYVLIAAYVNHVKIKKDSLRQWERLAFGFSLENLIKKEEILGYLFFSSKSIEWNAKTVESMDKLKFMTARWKKYKDNFVK
jgi:hypothetical protein